MPVIMLNALIVAGPLVLVPPAILAFRALFARFLREGAELFANARLGIALSRRIGHHIAVANVLILAITWAGALGWLLSGQSEITSLIIAGLGLVVGATATVAITGRLVGVRGVRGVLVGLLVFAGGNLPVFVAVPAALLLLS